MWVICDDDIVFSVGNVFNGVEGENCGVLGVNVEIFVVGFCCVCCVFNYWNVIMFVKSVNSV